ncbi:MAG: acetyl-CoA C-acyltransferase [Candidatus Thiodiazotropha endolucinida]|uniref:acetyl-CoA C-acyltransferase n=1 Tax=Candidatus Thiodiazotropha taylori TaxID=2792791 RepID=A0A9E4TRN3_9GAMM|nr:acetyl-CoA C-acyltransferase [Candidatus Thiodiazotropha sp. (ex Codakia orbicularis)]MCG7861460.1 acetyl-CoA C-acyltransferase [Candidatus Thiodiazotropha endolucinida]MCG7976857.1 acetyl-CoA C-acyltransferase [Candidatus Thiodiazotropha taylori]MCG8046293.1 acetyl-CoA C-acyltransferase [Candidatus Thiodiazotropha taylori]MCG8061404.1 acetyl-CoA C-acyltransferase [Candidatus Thiodiazotropha taylori]
MSEQAYIVAARRTPVGKAPRGVFRQTRPDDLLTHAIQGVLGDCPGLQPELIEDVIIGCAMPEAEQGLNVARVSSLLAGLPDSVPGVTINRFCSSGLQSIAMAADRIRLGEADIIVAGGVESMSMVPMMGNKVAINPAVFEDDNVAIAYGMGVTAENVAERWKVSREDQDSFALQSHQRALAAINAGHFEREILPYLAKQHLPDEGNTIRILERPVKSDEGPRPDSSLEGLAKLRPVFAAKGSVTAGNSSQMSDGAGAVVVMSERKMRTLNLEPLARFVGYSVAGVPAEIMGIGPKEAIPKLEKLTGVSLDQIDWIELNEAFAAQALAVMREMDMDPNKVNPLGGAIALGHPLGATGAIRTATLLHGMQRTNMRYGMVTMCIGTGMGAAGLFERC